VLEIEGSGIVTLEPLLLSADHFVKLASSRRVVSKRCVTFEIRVVDFYRVVTPSKLLFIVITILVLTVWVLISASEIELSVKFGWFEHWGQGWKWRKGSVAGDVCGSRISSCVHIFVSLDD
jgi:hypothetical protein